MKYYSIKKIKSSLPKEKNKKSSLWVKLVIRKLSFVFTWIFINLGFSANLVSYFSILISISGFCFLLVNNYIYRIIGAILINFWLVLDCVDGNIARCKKKFSPYGSMIDSFGGYFTIAFSYLGIGVAAFNTSKLLNDYSYIFIILGALTGVFELLARLLHQKRENTILSINKEINKNEVKKYSFGWFKQRLDKEIGLSGLFMPFLLISSFCDCYDFILFFYFVFNLLVMLVILLYFIIDAERKIKNEKI